MQQFIDVLMHANLVFFTFQYSLIDIHEIFIEETQSFLDIYLEM